MGSFGPQEWIIIILIVLLLFGAKKLPELARGSGRALRIFKAETKGIMDDDDDDKKAKDASESPQQITPSSTQPPATGPAQQPEQQPTQQARPQSDA